MFYVDSGENGVNTPSGTKAQVIATHPSDDTGKSPIVLVPGLGLAPYIYYTTPDGRSGWAERFAEAGYPAYIFNPPRNVSSGGLNTKAFQGDDLPSLSRWSLERAWPTWGFGPKVGEPYENVRYPVANVDQLVASFPAYLSSSGGDGRNQYRGSNTTNDSQMQSLNDTIQGEGAQDDNNFGGGRFASPNETGALKSLLERIGPVTLLVHSAAGASGVAVAQAVPNLVEQIVMVEPVGCPTDEQTVTNMGDDLPVMAIYGDYVDERRQTGRKTACEKTVNLASRTNPKSTMLSLPDEGVVGNTHLMMQDNNNAIIADRIRTWIEE
jgi:pimeloyl-ACP methyl ester carboxylesterase